MDKQTILIIIGLVIILTLINLLHSDIFKIKAIEIVGNELLTDKYILNASGLEQGNNIFAINCQKIKQKLMVLPQIKKVRVTRDLPNKVVVKLKERQPIALVSVHSSYCLIAAEGWILRIVNDLAHQRWPLITGVKIKKQSQKRILITQSLTTPLTYLQELSVKIRHQVKRVNILKTGVRIKLLKGGLVKLGQNFSPEKKAKVFSSIYRDMKKKNLKIEYANLKYDNFSFVKPK